MINMYINMFSTEQVDQVSKNKHNVVFFLENRKNI